MVEDNPETPQDTPKETTPTEEPNPIVTDLDRADQIAQMQKRENDRREKLIVRDEALAARKAIGGTSNAGQETKPVSKEDKKLNNAKEYFKDTALGDAIAKANE